MSFLEQLTDKQIDELLASINLKLLDDVPNNRMNSFTSKKHNKAIFLFCQEIEKSEGAKIREIIANKVLPFCSLEYTLQPTITLQQFALFDSLNQIDYTENLYNFVMNSPDFTDKFKTKYKKEFIKFYKKLSKKEQNDNNEELAK